MDLSIFIHVIFIIAPSESYGTVKGSLPDLRHDCCCPRRYQGHSVVRLHGQSVGSTESLLDDSEVFIQRSSHNVGTDYTMSSSRLAGQLPAKQQSRRCSENDIGRSNENKKQNMIACCDCQLINEIPVVVYSAQVTHHPSRASRSCQNRRIA